MASATASGVMAQPATSEMDAGSGSGAHDLFASMNRMDWPGPNRYRGSDGAPGPDYWQQRADYKITAVLDTGAREIRGNLQLTYTNNSPDTLRYVWLQLDQNLYRKGSEGSVLFPEETRQPNGKSTGGFLLADVEADGHAVRPRVADTMMRIDLPNPLRPHGGTLNLAIRYSFDVPDHGSDRMGRDSSLFEIAQWYPRMAVYDDVIGWNTDPYLGQGEFYLEYGDIDYSVTVPAGFTVAASGVLENAAEVLTPEENARLREAGKAAEVVHVITAAEANKGPVTGTKTWHFLARNVRDAAWAAAPDFRWDATSWDGVLCQAFYESPKAGKAWEDAAEQTQWTIKHYSQTFLPYPYSTATSVAGPVDGMEYPTFVMVGYGNDDPASIFSTLNHEQGHEWFPMVVGSNERRYAWMDEGINTYINTFAIESRYPAHDESLSYWLSWQSVVRSGRDAPLMTAADRIHPAALGAIGYRKPALVLLMLRNQVVGPDLFDTAFRQYIRDWSFKHPTPGDFFRSIENGTGRDLSWFWRGFFYSTDVLDIGIDSVAQAEEEGQPVVVIGLRRTTEAVFPVSLRIGYADGSTEDFSLPVDIWARGKTFAAMLPARARVTGVRLWPDPSTPDWNSANDTWGQAPARKPRSPVTRAP